VHAILHPVRGAEAAGAAVPVDTLRAVARLTQHGLRGVLGTSALFSNAYGNVAATDAETFVLVLSTVR
jgi:hypothetical protein